MFRSTLRLTARSHLPTRVQTPRLVLTQIPIKTLAHSRSIHVTGDSPPNYSANSDYAHNPISDTSTPPHDPFADHYRIRILQNDHAALQTEVRQLREKLKELEANFAKESESSSEVGGWVIVGVFFLALVVKLAEFQGPLEQDEKPARTPGPVQVGEEKEGKLEGQSEKDELSWY